MAVNINDMVSKMPQVDKSKIINWVTEISLTHPDSKSQEKYLMDRYFLEMTTDSSRRATEKNRFIKKWNINPDTGKRIEQEALPVENEDEAEEPFQTTDDTGSDTDSLPTMEPESVESETENTSTEDSSYPPKEMSSSDAQIEEEEPKEDDSSDLSAEEEASLDFQNSSSDMAIEEEPEEVAPDSSDLSAEEEASLDFQNSSSDMAIEEEPEEIEPDLVSDDSSNQSAEEESLFDDDLLDFQNPDLSDLQIDNEDEGPELLDDFEHLETPDEVQSPKDYFKQDAEMFKQEIPNEDVQKMMRSYHKHLKSIKSDSSQVIRLAQQIDMKTHMPYQIMRNFVIDHPLKDPANRKVLISARDPNHPNSTIQVMLSLPDAIEEVSAQISEGYWSSVAYNWGNLKEEFRIYVEELVALIYILEIYCEIKDTPPWEMHVPKQFIIEQMSQHFKDTNKLIVTQVLTTLKQILMNIQKEFGDIGNKIEIHIGRIDSQLAKAVEKVYDKVKTDIEKTNLEDVKRSENYILNKRESAKKLGSVPYAVICCMCDDLQRLLINNGWKLDDIRNFRRYSTNELARALGYKASTPIIRAVPILIRQRSLILHKDGTISLPK